MKYLVLYARPQNADTCAEPREAPSFTGLVANSLSNLDLTICSDPSHPQQ